MQEGDTQIFAQIISFRNPQAITKRGGINVINISREEDLGFTQINFLSQRHTKLVQRVLDQIYLAPRSLCNQNKVISEKQMREFGTITSAKRQGRPSTIIHSIKNTVAQPLHAKDEQIRG